MTCGGVGAGGPWAGGSSVVCSRAWAGVGAGGGDAGGGGVLVEVSGVAGDCGGELGSGDMTSGVGDWEGGILEVMASDKGTEERAGAAVSRRGSGVDGGGAGDVTGESRLVCVSMLKTLWPCE